MRVRHLRRGRRSVRPAGGKTCPCQASQPPATTLSGGTAPRAAVIPSSRWGVSDDELSDVDEDFSKSLPPPAPPARSPDAANPRPGGSERCPARPDGREPSPPDSPRRRGANNRGKGFKAPSKASAKADASGLYFDSSFIRRTARAWRGDGKCGWAGGRDTKLTVRHTRRGEGAGR